tara:strand:- start:4219 stop:5376 length:1158 start_codon:yes stop_codon:yes gene_type:complete
MSNDLEQLEQQKAGNSHNIPLKHQGVIKAQSDITKGIVKLKPIKTFDSKPSIQEPLASVEKVDGFNKKVEKEESQQEETMIDKQQASSLIEAEDQIDSYAVMKRNINEEMEQYRNIQIQSIQDELIELRASAKQEGYQDGYEEGKGLFQDYSEQLLASINDLGKNKREDIIKKRDFIIELSLSVAEHIVCQQIQKDDAIFDRLFLETIEKITEKDYVVITINPDDKPLLDSLREKFEDKFKDIQRLDVRTDNKMISGGCTIDTNLGFIDATVTSKLAILKKAIDEFHEKEDMRELSDDNQESFLNLAIDNIAKEDSIIENESTFANDNSEEAEKEVIEDSFVQEEVAEEEEEENEEEDLDDDDTEIEDLFDGLDLSDFDDTFDEF